MLVLALERATDGHDSRHGPMALPKTNLKQPTAFRAEPKEKVLLTEPLRSGASSSQERARCTPPGCKLPRRDPVCVWGYLEYLLPWPRSAAQQRPDSSRRHLLCCLGGGGQKWRHWSLLRLRKSCRFTPGPEAPAADEGILDFSTLGTVHLHLQRKGKGFCWQRGSSVPVPAALLMLKRTVQI